MTAGVKVAMLVNNTVAGDSRVQKVAWSMAAAGYDVTLIGIAPPGQTQRQYLRIGHADVILAPAERVMATGRRRPGGPTYRQAVRTLRSWDAEEVSSRAGARRWRGMTLRAAVAWSTVLSRLPALDRLSQTVRRSPLGKAALLAAGLIDPDGGWRQLKPVRPGPGARTGIGAG